MGYICNATNMHGVMREKIKAFQITIRNMWHLWVAEYVVIFSTAFYLNYPFCIWVAKKWASFLPDSEPPHTCQLAHTDTDIW